MVLSLLIFLLSARFLVFSLSISISIFLLLEFLCSFLHVEDFGKVTEFIAPTQTPIMETGEDAIPTTKSFEDNLCFWKSLRKILWTPVALEENQATAAITCGCDFQNFDGV
jgi:hypothetical protein